MKLLTIKSSIFSFLFVFTLFTFLLSGCSSEENSTEQEGTQQEQEEEDDPQENDPSDLNTRFVFNQYLVIEHSWNTGCDSSPCDTNQEEITNVFNNSLPNDPYFYMQEDEVELNLECQPEKGRRVEFKQVSEGPLTSFSKMEFEGIYYDVPNDGFTIAQVHNRGGNSNKPFFRLELHNDKLETVIRKDPEVSSDQTTFTKTDFSFANNVNYTQFPLKVILEKNGGYVHIIVKQDTTTILDESFQPESNTNWVDDNGIANGFYLKAGAYNPAASHTENIVLGYTTFKFDTNDLN